MKKHRPRRHNKPEPPRATAASRTKAALAEQRAAFYHGGFGRLSVGDYILPRNSTGQPGSRAG